MPTEDAMRGPYVETSRLRYDNGRAGRCRGAARQTQLGGWAYGYPMAYPAKNIVKGCPH